MNDAVEIGAPAVPARGRFSTRRRSASCDSPGSRAEMDFNRLTIKSQEAMAAAVEDATAPRQPRGVSRAPAAGATRPGAAAFARPIGSVAARRCGIAARAEAGRGRRRTAAAHLDRAVERARQGRLQEAQQLDDEYVSVEHLLLALRRRSRATSCWPESRKSAARSASPPRTPRARTRRSRSSAAT